MGLHRVADVLAWLRTQPCDREPLQARLAQDGVRTAAWATLRWTELLAQPDLPAGLGTMLAGLQPGALRRAGLDAWLEHDLPARMAGMHWALLLGFSPFLHDTPRDSARALAGRVRARGRSTADLEAFGSVSRPGGGTPLGHREQRALEQVSGEGEHVGLRPALVHLELGGDEGGDFAETVAGADRIPDPLADAVEAEVHAAGEIQQHGLVADEARHDLRGDG
jgi:hypothetical protein